MPKVVIADDSVITSQNPLHSGTFKWVWFKRRALANNSHLLVLRAMKAQALNPNALLPIVAVLTGLFVSSTHAVVIRQVGFPETVEIKVTAELIEWG